MRTLAKSIILFSCFLLFYCSSKDNAQSTVVPYEEGQIDTGDGAQLYYQKVGNGETKVIIPLALFLYEGLKPLADDGTKTLIFYDVRNRGRSSHITDSTKISIWKDVKDVETVRNHFGYDKVDVVGWSYSGLMVMLYASRHPEHVDRVVQIGPVAVKWNDKFPDEYRNTDSSPVDSLKAAEVNKLLAEGYNREHPREFSEQWYSTFVFPTLFGDQNNVKKYDAILKATIEPENEVYNNFMWHLNHHFVGSIMNMNTDSVRQVVMSFDKPVLTIHGNKDRNAPYASGREWATQLPNGRLVTVTGAAHLPWLENRELVLNSMDVFLKGEWPKEAEELN